mgnify:CR=1 FL=1
MELIGVISENKLSRKLNHVIIEPAIKKGIIIRSNIIEGQAWLWLLGENIQIWAKWRRSRKESLVVSSMVLVVSNW